MCQGTQNHSDPPLRAEGAFTGEAEGEHEAGRVTRTSCISCPAHIGPYGREPAYTEAMTAQGLTQLAG